MSILLIVVVFFLFIRGYSGLSYPLVLLFLGLSIFGVFPPIVGWCSIVLAFLHNLRFQGFLTVPLPLASVLPVLKVLSYLLSLGFILKQIL